jgi:hypothetical protein
MEEKATGSKASQPMFSVESAAGDFAVVKASLLSDTSISYTAKGVLLTCLSNPRSFTKSWIASHGSENGPVISAALKELLTLGYLKKFSQDDETFYVFTDSPELPVAPVAPAPRKRSSRASEPVEPIALEPWLEPYREPLEGWLRRRLKAHPTMEWEITSRSMAALRYANEQKVLAEFCDLAAEKSWQSLGFIGYKESVDKLAKEKHGKAARPMMSEISYTLR